VRERLARGARPAAVCEALCDRCLAPDTEGSVGRGCDNMSAMVVSLRRLSPLAAAPGAAAVDLARLPPPPADPDAAVVGARREVPPGRGASLAVVRRGGVDRAFCCLRPCMSPTGVLGRRAKPAACCRASAQCTEPGARVP